MAKAFVPFLIGDAVKAALVAGVATTVLPKKSHREDGQ
jgi:biotin transporter BioY